MTVSYSISNTKKTRFLVLQTSSDSDFLYSINDDLPPVVQLTYKTDTNIPYDVYNLKDRMLTISSYRIIEESLHEDWENEDDEYWQSFLND